MSTLSEMAIAAIDREWSTSSRWAEVERTYEAADVVRLRGSVRVEHTLARRGAERLWQLMQNEEYVNALGAMTGGQAIEMVKAGLKAIYLSGCQVAADSNLSEQIYPDQSLSADDSVPAVVRRVNNALRRADQIEWAETSAEGDGETSRDWMVPIVADADAGFGGALEAYDLMKSMIEAGAAGVHFEDQFSSEEKGGHTGGKVLIPTGHHIRTFTAARLAADVAGVSTIIIARTDALGADRGLAYAPYADVIWCETSSPDLAEAQVFAERIKAQYPDKLLAYHCSPSFNWRKHLDDDTIARFQKELGAMGYALQFVPDRESTLEPTGYSGTRHQREVGAGYFDDITTTVSGGFAPTLMPMGEC